MVYLDRFEASKSLSVKNLIGRAGRSTKDKKFDYGSVVIRNNAITAFRKVVNKLEPLSDVSRLDVDDSTLDDKYKEFKEAINNDQFSDEYNLTNADIEKLKTDEVEAIIPALLDMMFEDGHLVSPDVDMKDIYDIFYKLYELYLGRELSKSEKAVLSSAVKIMIWKVYGKTFHLICQYRYSYASRATERRRLYEQGKVDEAKKLNAHYMMGCHDIPDKNLTTYPLISSNTAANDVDYDLIVYDTYDYLDKLIGFKLSDIFYAIFHQYYEKNGDMNALKLAKYFKYGTDSEREIWMLRYGLSFEDMEWAAECIDQIDESEIKFNNKLQDLDEEKRKVLEPFIYS